MTLHLESRGRGPDVFLVHGWGLHGGVWHTTIDQLSNGYRVTAIDLPGHGRSPENASFDLDAVVQQVLDRAPVESVWIGWSLGALVALAAAHHAPERVSRLVLTGATPRFVRDSTWRCALAASVLADFGAGLERDYRATLMRFLTLQAGPADRGVLRALREELANHPPTPSALRDGLRILSTADLRSRLADIAQPTLVLHGAHDRLAWPAAGVALAGSLPHGRYLEFPDAGHACFLAQPERWIDAVRSFLDA